MSPYSFYFDLRPPIMRKTISWAHFPLENHGFLIKKHPKVIISNRIRESKNRKFQCLDISNWRHLGSLFLYFLVSDGVCTDHFASDSVLWSLSQGLATMTKYLAGFRLLEGPKNYFPKKVKKIEKNCFPPASGDSRWTCRPTLAPLVGGGEGPA